MEELKDREKAGAFSRRSPFNLLLKTINTVFSRAIESIKSYSHPI